MPASGPPLKGKGAADFGRGVPFSLAPASPSSTSTPRQSVVSPRPFATLLELPGEAGYGGNGRGCRRKDRAATSTRPGGKRRRATGGTVTPAACTGPVRGMSGESCTTLPPRLPPTPPPPHSAAKQATRGSSPPPLPARLPASPPRPTHPLDGAQGREEE